MTDTPGTLEERLRTHFDDCPPSIGDTSQTRPLLTEAADEIARLYSLARANNDLARRRADEIASLRARVEAMRETVVAFAGPWSATWAREYGLPDGHLHPTHYDILEKAGARMDDFTRAVFTSAK